MINNKEIGVYDSGIGGLTVLKELVKLMPNEKYIYFGDLKNLPYGEKTKDELLIIGRKIFNFFLKKEVKAVVMACNTTSALLYDILKKEYPFKIYPVIQTVSKEIATDKIQKIGVFATKATINSHAYKNEMLKYNPNLEIYEQDCPNWVKIVENQNFSQESIKIIETDLKKMLKNKPDKIILGCTHYPYLTNILNEISPNSKFINPAKKLSELIKLNLSEENLLSNNNFSKITYYVSDTPEKFADSSKKFYKIESKPILIDI